MMGAGGPHAWSRSYRSQASPGAFAGRGSLSVSLESSKATHTTRNPPSRKQTAFGEVAFKIVQ